jgi:transcriptional regulator with XRE-family HTH domain
MFMMKSHKIIAENVRRLMEYRHLNQTALAKKTGISQRTISNVLSPGSVGSITMDTVEKISAYFGVEPYHMLIPSLPTDELLSDNIEQIISCYALLDSSGRGNVKRITLNEARYLPPLPSS